jgi:hypothetical protein
MSERDCHWTVEEKLSWCQRRCWIKLATSRVNSLGALNQYRDLHELRQSPKGLHRLEANRRDVHRGCMHPASTTGLMHAKRTKPAEAYLGISRHVDVPKYTGGSTSHMVDARDGERSTPVEEDRMILHHRA